MKLQKKPSSPLKISPKTPILMHDPKTSPSNSKSYSRLNPSSTTGRAAMDLIEKNGKSSQKHEVISHGDWYSEVQFRPVNNQNQSTKVDDFGAMSPPLWKNSPSPAGSPARSPSRPLLSHRGYKSLSPDSRARAIAKGRSELMEMVRHMPESSYELSLKDIVEHHHRAENQNPKTGEGEGAARVKKGESKRIDRNLSFENKGMFLNMAFPFSFNSKRKKKIAGGNSGRVSPKPEGLKGAGGERDWWKKKFTGSSDSDSSRTSDNSAASATTISSGATASSGDRPERMRSGCFQCFNSRRRSKSAE